METSSLLKFWPLMHSVIQEFWTITEPQIEEAAVRANVPIELYYYGELGLDHFSIKEFQGRDPFSNPEQFERQFARLNVKDWIAPTIEDGRYKVAEKARAGVRRIVQAGDDCLSKFDKASKIDLDRLLSFLKLIVLANNSAPEPPQRVATANRFRVATGNSPAVVQIRECLMDLFAYRDDSHLSAARPYFNQAGIVWIAFGSVCNGKTVTAEKIAEATPFRGYETSDYAAALQAGVEVGWLEETEPKGAFKPTQIGKDMHDRVEKLTNEHFYRPWTTFSQTELDELYGLLLKLREQLHGFRKTA